MSYAAALISNSSALREILFLQVIQWKLSTILKIIYKNVLEGAKNKNLFGCVIVSNSHLNKRKFSVTPYILVTKMYSSWYVVPSS